MKEGMEMGSGGGVRGVECYLVKATAIHEERVVVAHEDDGDGEARDAGRLDDLCLSGVVGENPGSCAGVVEEEGVVPRHVEGPTTPLARATSLAFWMVVPSAMAASSRTSGADREAGSAGECGGKRLGFRIRVQGREGDSDGGG